jgi:hypothetical protein
MLYIDDGIFGDYCFLNEFPKLNSKDEYDCVIKKLEIKINDIEGWII